MNQRVSFTKMSDGTADDFRIIAENDRKTDQALPDRIVQHLKMQADDDGAYLVDRLEHVLQTATRAHRDGADDDWIVGCLLHDIGDVLAPHTHGQVAYEILRPFVRDEVAWVVKHHGVFQCFYNASLSQTQRNAREAFAEHEYYRAAVNFCENWDQCSFDPAYDSLPLESFLPVLQRVFSRNPFEISGNGG